VIQGWKRDYGTYGKNGTNGNYGGITNSMPLPFGVKDQII
jgi:hypothetical protein